MGSHRLLSGRMGGRNAALCLQTNFNRTEDFPDPSLYSSNVTYNLTCNCLLWTDNPCQGEIAYVSSQPCAPGCDIDVCLG